MCFATLRNIHIAILTLTIDGGAGRADPLFATRQPPLTYNA